LVGCGGENRQKTVTYKLQNLSAMCRNDIADCFEVLVEPANNAQCVLALSESGKPP